MVISNLAVATDQKNGGNTLHASEGLVQGWSTDDHRIVDAHFFHEWFHHGCTFFIQRNADDRQALRPILFLQLDQAWNFSPAGGTPGGPEIYQRYFALHIG